MVEDMFAPRVKEEFQYRSRINVVEFDDPIDKLISDVKKALQDYNNSEKSKLSIKILEGNREVGILST